MQVTVSQDVVVVTLSESNIRELLSVHEEGRNARLVRHVETGVRLVVQVECDVVHYASRPTGMRGIYPDPVII